MREEREFVVSISAPGYVTSPFTIRGRTFFYARAAAAQRFGVEPGDIRLDPPRRYQP